MTTDLRNGTLQELQPRTRLYAVVGHAALEATYLPSDLPDNPFDAESKPWVLQSFQAGEPVFYGQHLKAGIDGVLADDQGLLVISGGYTRQESVTTDNQNGHNWSEAYSYLVSGERSGWYTIKKIDEVEVQDDSGTPVKIRIATISVATENGEKEVPVALNEYARDSLENVLGDVATHLMLTGRLPEKVTVYGWSFKDERFNMHATTLGIPEEVFTYVSVNQPRDEDLEGALKGEAKAVQAFRDDPLGNKYAPNHDGYEDSLQKKRDGRDPLGRGNPHWTQQQAIAEGYEAE